MLDSEPNHYYFQHLSRLSSQSKVIARDSIRISTNDFLCKRGEVVPEKVFSELFTLVEWGKFQESIAIKNQLTDARLWQQVKGFIDSDESVAGFFVKEDINQKLREFCGYAAESSFLLQRLTVLSIVYPGVFDRSVFCAIFGVLVLIEREKDIDEQKNIFVVGLYQDIGLLEIDSGLQKSKDRLTREDNQAYYQHALLGSAVLKNTGFYPEPVVEAVKQHHEHIDGTGFPNGSQGISLSELGQVTHLLNNLYMVYDDYFKPRNRTLTDTIPIIEMNSVSRFGAIAKSVIDVLEKGKNSLTSDLTDEHVKPVIEAVKKRYAYIGSAHQAIESFTRNVGFRHDHRELFVLQNGFIHIAMTLMKSATINDGYVRWLDHLEKHKLQHAYREIEDTFLMMNEVIYHIETFKQQLSFYRDICKDVRVKACVEETLSRLQEQSIRELSQGMSKNGWGQSLLD